MSTLRYEFDQGVRILVDDIESEFPGFTSWIGREALTASSWTEFQQRTARVVIDGAKRAFHDNWSSASLYRLQKHLLGEVGVAMGELSGAMGTSFSSFLLRSLMEVGHSQVEVLFVLLAVAALSDCCVDRAGFHSFLFDLQERSGSPFTYAFEFRLPGSVYSEQLDADFTTLEKRGFLCPTQDIRVTPDGLCALEKLRAEFPTLLPAVSRLVPRARNS